MGCYRGSPAGTIDESAEELEGSREKGAGAADPIDLVQGCGIGDSGEP
jgi:hypothetical protein